MSVALAAAAIGIRAAVSEQPEKPGVRHVPVMLEQAMAHLKVRPGGFYVDGTFGAGGYARAILAVPETRLLAIDRDPAAVAAARELAVAHPGRVVVHHGRFSEMEAALASAGITGVDGVVLDLGVSSMQLDEAERGFSFRHDGPLDMRMEGRGLTAADVVNTLDAETLAGILRTYGEERRARAIARAIVRAREAAPITTTGRLAEIVAAVAGPRRPGQVHPATRTFQALRIFVNRELDELAAGLAAAERVLVPGGRLVVVSFHSLEDRIVKRFIAVRGGRLPETAAGARHLPAPEEKVAPGLKDVARGGIVPTPEEVAANPRARSARLRAAERTTAPAVTPEPALLGVPQPSARSGGRGSFRGKRGRRRGG